MDDIKDPNKYQSNNPNIDPNRTSRLEALKKKLFSKNEALLRKNKEGVFSHKEFEVGETWQEEKMKPVKKQIINFRAPSSLFKKFFVGAVLFLVIGVIFAFAMLYTGENTVSTERVIITILGNSYTAGGEELPIDVIVKNENSVSIDSADLIIEYPRGGSTASAGDYERKRITLKSISPGEEVSEHVSVILYGEQGTTKDIRARLEYNVRGSISTFTKEEIFKIQINTAPLVLSIDAPAESVSGQDYELKIKASVASTHLGKNAIVKVDYPPGFRFVDATPSPILGNNIFPLSKTSVGSENIISIRGKVIGINGDIKAFRISAGDSDTKDGSLIAVLYNTTVQEVTIGQPFINATLTLGGKDLETFAVNASDKIETKIKWANNLPASVNNVEIRAKIYGNALNKASITSSGFYDSNTGEVIWDVNTVPGFVTMQPGAKGELTLGFASLSLLAGSNTVIPDPTITIEISIKGSQPSEGVVMKELNGFEKKDFKINTDLQLSGKTLYSTGPITNLGPIPPKVGAETTYTLLWTITNTSNKASKSEVRSTLPANVSFVKLDPGSNEDLKYNDTTKEVIWNVGNVARGTGFVVPAKTVAFQVMIKPSTSQVGSTPNLLNEAIFTATDLFTNNPIRKLTIKLTTLIAGELNFPPNGQKVIQ